jgi:hypothetical protein
MKSALLAPLPAVGLAGVLLGCSNSGVVKPRAPDMTALVESYDRPTGELDPRDTADIAAAVGVVGTLLDNTEILPRVRELLGDLLDPVNFDDLNESADNGGLNLNLRANGYLKATRICPGWASSPEVNAANGSILATATFSQRGPDPVVWGTVDSCRYRVGDRRIELTPRGAGDALRVYWGEDVDRESLDTQDLVISVNLRADIDGESAAAAVDLRVLGDGALEYRVPVDSGVVIARANDDGTFQLRTRDGDFACDDNFDCALEPGDAN